MVSHIKLQAPPSARFLRHIATGEQSTNIEDQRKAYGMYNSILTLPPSLDHGQPEIPQGTSNRNYGKKPKSAVFGSGDGASNSALNAINGAVTLKQLDVVARTILGEARPNDPEGAAAVAWVIRNRAESGKFPSDPAKVAKQPKQFSAWNTGAGGNKLPYQSAENNPAYQAAYNIAQQVFSGQTPDPTGGATYYHTPAVHPGWDKNMTQTAALGGHVFYSPGGGKGGGNSGPAVRDIQQQLASRGFSPGAIDGVKGPNTNAAIRAFQQANGLTVDGIVGSQTRAALSAGGGMPVPMQAGGPTPSFGAPGSPPPIPRQRPQFPTQAVSAPQIAPTPYPRPMAPPQVPQQMQAPAVQQLRLASGKTIAPGVYPSNDGRHQVQISNDGAGNAKITPINNPFEIRGVIDPMREMNAPTLAGSLIRAKVPEAMQSGIASVGQNIGNAATGVQNTALGAVNAIGQGAQGIGSNIANAFSGFGNMFGGHVPTVPAAPTFAQMQAMRAVPQNAYMPPRQVAPVPRNRPFFGGVSAPPPVPQQRVAISAPQQSSGGNNRAQQAQNDLRNSGMVNSFGMVV